MSDTKTDSDDSIVFMGISKNIQVTADVHQQVYTSPKLEVIPETPDFKKRKLLPTHGEPTSIQETQGKITKYNNY